MLESRKIWLLALIAVMLVPAILLLTETRAQDVIVTQAPEADEPMDFFEGSAHDVAYMGVQLEEETEHPEGGARVSEVVHDSPAEKAGLQAGDIIVVFDGKTIRGPVALTKQIHERKPGDTVRIDVLRDGKVKTLDIELADRFAGRGRRGYRVAPFGDMTYVTPEMEKELQEKIERSLEHLEHIELPEIYELRACEEDEDCEGIRDFNFQFRWGGKPRLGVQLVEATPELKEHLGSSDGTGVLVSKVMRGLPAEHAGVQVGDLIVRIGGDSIEDVSDLRRALSNRAGETFAIDLMRRVPRVQVAPRVHAVPPAAPVVPAPPDVVVPPAPVAPRSRQQVEAMERQREELYVALAEVQEEARRVAEVERVAARESQRQARAELARARELARTEASRHQEEVVRAEFERAREAYRESVGLQREEAQRQREEIRRLRERMRGADGSV
jgi:membrane-associated protease RseP (regulator of RpoE activity)